MVVFVSYGGCFYFVDWRGCLVWCYRVCGELLFMIAVLLACVGSFDDDCVWCLVVG